MEETVVDGEREATAAPRLPKSRSNGNGHNGVAPSPNATTTTVQKYTPLDPNNDPKLSRAEYVQLFFNLKRVRMFEEALSRMYRQGKILGGVYSGKGQEAIGVGTTFPLKAQDIVSPIHRDMGVFLLKGMPMRRLMCQILGRRSGPSKGKDSWSHTGDMDYNILASSSMLASSVPIACGAALATQMQGKDSVAVTYFGEGSTARGDFHEGINMAAIYRLPVVFICENNFWAYSTPVTREMADTNMAARAAAYGMEGFSIDGNDILSVTQTMRTAVERARRGDGPTFIECRTYRMSGHSEHDEATYRSKGELSEWERRDPLGRYREYLAAKIKFNDDDEDRMKTQIEAEVQDARRFADGEPYPEAHEALEGVYVP